EDGLVGLGELGGGGESAEATVRAVGEMLVGHDPFRLEELWAKVCNPTASLYNRRTQIHAALEFACLDLIGQRLKVPVSELLGGRVRDSVDLASYLFYRYPGQGNGPEEIRTADQLVAHAIDLKSRYGFTSHKLKGGVFPYGYEIECYEALVAAMPGDRFRYDPNAAYSVRDALKIARRIRDLPNDYLEDPTFGLGGLRQVRREGVPIATNTVVVDFEQLATNVLDRAADVILLDTTFWGGIRQCQKAAVVCDTFQIGISVHSSGELGVQLATMLHLAAILPTLGFAIDAHYHQLTDDVVVGGKRAYEGGSMKVPTDPGLGVKLDVAKVTEYAELYKRLGGYPYDRDPARSEWFSLVPNQEFADPERFVSSDELDQSVYT
ncbi:MAG: enolase C-terminal domain-like protein, partial [Acidimicrobiales bacterium]